MDEFIYSFMERIMRLLGDENAARPKILHLFNPHTLLLY